ncbi:MAG TPA: glycerol-3-phosphate acyltransferase, partial [Clostridia bacterium]
VIGHNWPLYFGFKGGKGIFTTFAVVLMMDWKMGILLLGIFIVVVSISKFISLGSIIGSGMFPIVALFFKKPLNFIVFAALIGILAIIRHSANIKRILKGTESKFSLRKKNTA